MTVEFVEPEPPPGADPAAREAAAGPAGPAWPGRLAGVGVLVAAGLTAAALRLTLYRVTRTAVVVDFDGSVRIPTVVDADAFGHLPATAVSPLTGEAPSGSSTTIDLADGAAFGTVWIVVAVLLGLAGLWALASPRSARPAAVAAAVGGVSAGVVASVYLQVRTVVELSAPLIPFRGQVAAGFWLFAAGAALALLAGLLPLLMGHRRGRGDRA